MKWLVFLAMFLDLRAHAQIIVGNGGDTVRCRASDENDLDGVYVYDYLATYNPVNQNADIADHQDPPRRIYNILVANLPDLGGTLRTFLDDAYHQIGNLPQSDRRHVWQPANMRDFVVEDENVVSGIPRNCRNENDPTKFEFNQTVYREQMPDNKLYRYEAEILGELFIDPMQKSFMLIHEWLWDYCETASHIREVNRFLHSVQAEGLGPEQLQIELRRRGMQLMPILPRTLDVNVTIVNNGEGGIDLDIEGFPDGLIELAMHQRAFLHYTNQSAYNVLLEPTTLSFPVSIMSGTSYSGWDPSPLPAHLVVKYLNDAGDLVDSGHRLVFRRVTD